MEWFVVLYVLHFVFFPSFESYDIMERAGARWEPWPELDSPIAQLVRAPH